MYDKGYLEQKVMELFGECLHYQPPSAQADLFEEGGLDSIMFVELLARLEETFHMEIPLEELELEDFSTIERIAAFLAREGEGGGSAGVSAPKGYAGASQGSAP